MNKSGQMAQISGLIMLAIAVIVGAILLQGSAQNIGNTINTVTVNDSATLAANSASIYLTNYRAINSVVVVNASNQSQVVPASNYTVTNEVIDPTTQGLSVKVTTNSATWGSKAVYIQGTGQLTTYANDSGSRAITSLIIVLMAVALISVVVVYVVKNYKE